MADSKITALTSISTSTDPANDPLVIVDVSDTSMAATGTAKKVTLNQLLGASGTATLASATITGDLTVDTSTLKVDSANNRVGIGTASPGALIEAYTNTNGQNRVFINNPSTGSSAYNSIDFTGGTAGNQILSMGSGYSGSFPYTTGALVLRSGQVNGMVLSTGGSAAPIVFGINDSEAMRLNSTGLGVGVSPSAKLDVRQIAAAEGLKVYVNDTGATNIINFRSYDNTLGEVTRYAVACNGVATWSNVGGVAGTAMTLNSTGLGVGVTPSAKLDVQTSAGRFKVQNYGGASVKVSSSGALGYEVSTGNGHQFFIDTTQAMTLDASGNLLVGTTSNNPAGTQSQFVNQWSGGSKWGSTFNQTVSSASYYTHIAFCTNGTVRGSIDANNAAITYGTVSDYRLKEAVQPLVGGLARISALKPSTYKWKESQSDGEGFIAHELASVVPLAVIGEKDALNEDGSIKAQQVDLSKVVPVLVAAIQELTARVQTLETR